MFSHSSAMTVGGKVPGQVGSVSPGLFLYTEQNYGISNLLVQ